MQLLYTLGIYLYTLGVLLASPFNAKAASWVKGRRNWRRQLPTTSRKVIWFHCASLGEFDQGLPLMNKLKKEDPSIFLLVTFFSPSGMEHYHKRKHPVDHAMYLPIDTRGNARYLISKLKPATLFIVKYEFWCNLLIAADKLRLPVFSISTQLRPDQRFFKWYGSYFRKALRSVNYFFVQQDETALMLKQIGIDRVMTTGDTRFDRVIENREQVQSNASLEFFLNGQKAIIIGSSWPEDEAITLPFMLNHPEEKYIIAPHDISEDRVGELTEKLGSSACRYTDLTSEFSGNTVILNTIGHLASAYSYGKIAYVGGGFSGKLHNILEPAVFGLPVIYGPKFSRFPEAKMFLEEGMGYSVSTAQELEHAIHSADHSLEEIGVKTKKVVDDNKGAAEKIHNHLKQHYNELIGF
jgi:3-deoxy-D-manno-octulosonic-acid transferase